MYLPIMTLSPDPVAALRPKLPQLLESLERLVGVESPSSDTAATKACAQAADEIATDLWGKRAEQIEREGRVHLRWTFGTGSKVLLLGHLDTVWPVGTTARWPFEVKGSLATGPGCFDMKGGVVQLFYALTVLDDIDGVTVLLTTDEELGSPSARGLIEETARSVDAALVLEPSAHGALKTERKGVGSYRLDVRGRAAHAGLDPDKGINAAVELAHQILAVSELARPEAGTNVSPNVARAGTSANTIPAAASAKIDVRAASLEEQERVDAALRGLTPVTPGTTVSVERVASSPPLPRSASTELFALAQRIATELGLEPLEEVSVGGGSDGNIVAGMGVRVLDGLGAVGDGAHAEGEHIEINALPERTALVAALVSELLRGER
jgi:glutamate carboxypeptidase